MSDLISRSALMQSLRNNVLVDVTPNLEQAIDEQPTAYDMDKVVERLEKDTDLAYNRYMDCSPNASQSVVARYSAQYQERARCLEIVKSGGID